MDLAQTINAMSTLSQILDMEKRLNEIIEELLQPLPDERVEELDKEIDRIERRLKDLMGE